MTNHIYIVPCPTDHCQICGEKAELRPYGKGGKWVCFDCGMTDEPEARRQFRDQFATKAGTVVLGIRA